MSALPGSFEGTAVTGLDSSPVEASPEVLADTFAALHISIVFAFHFGGQIQDCFFSNTSHSSTNVLARKLSNHNSSGFVRTVADNLEGHLDLVETTVLITAWVKQLLLDVDSLASSQHFRESGANRSNIPLQDVFVSHTWTVIDSILLFQVGALLIQLFLRATESPFGSTAIFIAFALLKDPELFFAKLGGRFDTISARFQTQLAHLFFVQPWWMIEVVLFG